jgi:penicillin-binding protein 1A
MQGKELCRTSAAGYIGGNAMADQNQKKAQGVRRKRRKRRPLALTVILRVFQTIGTLILVAVLTGSLVCCYGAIYIKTVIMPDAELDMSAYTMDENTRIYYYNSAGEAVELDTLSGDENRESVKYKDLPQDLIDAYVAIEDKRFWQHDGVDWYRTAGALVNMFFTMKNTFGGSTITQQLIKNVTEYDDGNVKRKVVEIFTALDLENRYKKEEIIAWYLNEIYLGNNCYGVQSAAKTYFGKDVSELTLAECASLAGITNNPSLYGPYSSIETLRHRCENPACRVWSSSSAEVCDMCGGTEFGEVELWDARRWNKERQITILKAMANPEISPSGAYITQEEYEAAVEEELVFVRDRGEEMPEGAEEEEQDPKGTSNIHSWYVDAVISEVITDLMGAYGWSESYAREMVYSGGLSIYIPYDPDIQAKVDKIYTNRTHLDESLNTQSKTGQQLSSAITVVDNSTGYVVAIAGDVGEKTINRAWNNALATRQPGSSIKPLAVYAPAVEMRLVTPASVVDDNPRLLGEAA